MGGIACALLLVGGLTALQQAAVLASVPFTFVIVGVAWCWIKALREETGVERGRRSGGWPGTRRSGRRGQGRGRGRRVIRLRLSGATRSPLVLV